MKTLLLLLIPVFSLAQPKKATKIIVKADTAGLLNKIALVLYENGYGVEQKDAAVGFISSTEKPVIYSASLKIRALLKDTCVVFTGTMALDVEVKLFDTALERTFDPVYYGGMKGSPIRRAWEELARIAQLIGTDVSYEK